MNDKKNIQASNRSSLAKKYDVGYKVFVSWIKENKELQKLIDSYLKKRIRTFPPQVIKKIYDAFGNPDE